MLCAVACRAGGFLRAADGRISFRIGVFFVSVRCRTMAAVIASRRRLPAP